MRKFEKVIEIIEKRNIEGVLIPAKSVNFYYFTGIDLEIPAFLIFTKEEEYIVMENIYEEYNLGFGKLNVFYVKNMRKFIERLSNFGYDGQSKKFVDISSDLEKIREIKDDEELKKIKNSCSCIENLFKFIVESEIYEKRDFECYFEIKKWLAENKLLESFDPIVAYDENSSFIHGRMSGKRFSKICLLDLGVKKEKYCSDATLTISKDDELNSICEKIKEVVDDILANVSTNISFSTLSKIAEEKVKKINEKYAYFKFHSLGHGIGLKVHEMPFVHSTNEEKIKEGVVFTIEPGIYVPNKYGIRFETVVAVKNGKGKKLLNIF